MFALSSRRQMLIGSSLALLCRPSLAALGSVQRRLAALEFAAGGRLGVAALDTASDRRIDYRSTNLWPMCSTFKFLLVAAVLARIDAGHEQADRQLTFNAADILDYAPIVKQKAAQGRMGVAELCAAAITHSDNSAANLLLQIVGGPGGVNAFARSLGDRTTHLDRIEPFLNDVPPGDARDTTSPAAMLNDLGMILLQDALQPVSRQMLTDWLIASTTGKDRLRAGLPADWRVGDKTGTWSAGATNDIAIAWPPGRPPLLIAAYFTDSVVRQSERNKLLADVARVVVEELVAGS